MPQLPAIGELFDGRFMVLGTIGRGGMGVVFEAEHLGLGRTVALKILMSQATPRAFERFLSEAQLTAAVRHPHVVSVLDFGVKDGITPYLVLERLEGEPLSNILKRRGKISWRDAVEIGDQILSGLGAAHKAGVVHRDLTPDNIFMCNVEDGHTTAKILDFGVALLARDEGRGDERGVGIVTGTPGYLAPEVALGLVQIDARADLFSVGVILYELICGRLPFEGDTPSDILAATLSAPVVRPCRHVENLPPALERLVLTALARRPEDRYASAAEMLEVLGAAAVGRVHERARICRTEVVGDRLDGATGSHKLPSEPPLPKYGPKRRSWRRATAVIVGFVVACGVLGWLLPRVLTLSASNVPWLNSAADEVSIWLDAFPADLKVEWNGVLIENRPLIVPRSLVAAKVRFFAPGFEDERRELLPSEDQTVRVELRSLESAP